MLEQRRITLDFDGARHQITEPVAALIAFNVRANSDDYLPDEERLALADKFEDALVGRTEGPLRFTRDERICLTKHVDILGAGPHDSPDLKALFWALRGTDPP